MKAKKTFILIAVTAIIALIPIISSSVAQAEDSEVCNNPLARVESGQSDLNNYGDVLCSGDEVLNPVDMQLYCFSSETSIIMTGRSFTMDVALCSQETAAGVSTAGICNVATSEQRVCSVPKGPEGSQFRLLSPDHTSGNRPSIAWEAVSDAASYSVHVVGPDIHWQQTVASSILTLDYPQAEPPLTVGSAYEIIVNSNSDDDSISASAYRVISIDSTASETSTHTYSVAMTQRERMRPSSKDD